MAGSSSFFTMFLRFLLLLSDDMKSVASVFLRQHLQAEGGNHSVWAGRGPRLWCNRRDGRILRSGLHRSLSKVLQHLSLDLFFILLSSIFSSSRGRRLLRLILLNRAATAAGDGLTVHLGSRVSGRRAGLTVASVEEVLLVVVAGSTAGQPG